MSNTQSLPTAVGVLEDKTKNHKQAKNTQFHVSVARHNIDEVNSELDDLVESLEHLRYYKTVLEDAFDGTAPTMVNSAIQAAEKVVETTQADLLENVQSGEVGDGEIDLASNDDTRNPEVQLTSEINKQIEQIQSVKRQVDNVTGTIKRQLESKRDEWSEKVGAAEELQKILGSQNEDFSRTLSHMYQLLTNDLMNSSGTGVRFVSKWTAAVGNWVEHQSLQSFDDFQRRHDLLDSTVTDVKALSRSKQLTLADVSIASLEEMKRVDEMESAVELSL